MPYQPIDDLVASFGSISSENGKVISFMWTFPQHCRRVVICMCEVIVRTMLVNGGIVHSPEVLWRQEVSHPKDGTDGAEQERLDNFLRLLGGNLMTSLR